jgi:hypothetical protein
MFESVTIQTLDGRQEAEGEGRAREAEEVVNMVLGNKVKSKKVF